MIILLGSFDPNWLPTFWGGGLTWWSQEIPSSPNAYDIYNVYEKNGMWISFVSSFTEMLQISLVKYNQPLFKVGKR